jgi:hypothetical protein
MTPAPGTRLGVYEVTGKSGEGDMGKMYQARDTIQRGARVGLRNAMSAFLLTEGET